MTPFQEPAWRIHEVEPASRLRNYKKRWRAALAWAAPSRLGGGRIYASFAGLRSAPRRRLSLRRQKLIDQPIGERAPPSICTMRPPHVKSPAPRRDAHP